MSSEVEQLLKRWAEAGIVLKIELSSKYMSVFGSGIVRSFDGRQLLLDGESCGDRILLTEATCESPRTELSAQPLRVSQSELLVDQLQISVPENQRVLLSEMRAYVPEPSETSRL